jgi:hypothetical protein
MMNVSILTAEATARAHTKKAEIEKEKLKVLLSSNAIANQDEALANNLLNTIQARQNNIIKRAQYITACKVSFFDETPTLPLESSGSNDGIVGV